MRLTATHQTLTTAHAHGARAEPLCIDNACDFNRLDSGRSGGERRWSELSKNKAHLQSYQNGTNQCAPLWNGPALRPAFVAQVLGQVIMGRPDRASELAVLRYRNGAPQVASRLLLDVSI